MQNSGSATVVNVLQSKPNADCDYDSNGTTSNVSCDKDTVNKRFNQIIILYKPCKSEKFGIINKIYFFINLIKFRFVSCTFSLIGESQQTFRNFMLRRKVYNRHTTDKQSAETAEASLAGEQGGTTPLTSMSTPTTFLKSPKKEGIFIR